MSQETNLGRQTSREEVEPKVNKRRKQGLDIVTTVNNTNNTTIQNIFQEYNTTVNDQNSRFELTPKNLAMMSSESVEVNNTEKEMDPIQITSMDIDSDGSKPHTDLEMSLEIDNTTEPIRDPWVARGDESQQRRKREPTDMAWADLVEKMCDFLIHKLESKPTTHVIPPAIAAKFRYLDREFFRTFTRNKWLTPAHQKEFDEIFNLTENRNKLHDKLQDEEEAAGDSLKRLPEDPAELKYDLGKLFPVKDRKKLKEVIRMKRSLAEYYTWEGKLPETYFKLPEKKLPLPTTPQDLSSRFREFFPIDLAKSEKSMREVVDMLRKDYYFKVIPNDYFIQKRRLPREPSKIQINTTYVYPIEDPIQAKKFIEEASLKYNIVYPILMQIMLVNSTDKPTLPIDPNKVKEVNLTVPIMTVKQLVETVKLLRTKYYFHRIPEDWIQIPKTEKKISDKEVESEEIEVHPNGAIRVDMPENLESVKVYLEQIEIPENHIKLPITEQTEVKTTLEELKKIFDFEKAPDFIFALPPLPQATWDIIL
ncbi:hypothetical protein C2G38_2200825 [Gigaspora rosea]|uniref:Uncharacterized protein n=1 Tax=Gigaspora rosea TaxID=44941 RepID=A0A397UQ09_9GLOM|nr:hypothetical protein C2G38_2200825 [Gigaspora rosea]